MGMIIWFGIVYFIYLQFKDYVNMSSNFKISMILFLSIPLVGAFFGVTFVIKIFKGFYKYCDEKIYLT
jgi:hypothetical protein